MKVAILSPYATVVPHFETELDIAQQHLDQGDTVKFLYCSGALENCDFNVEREPARCLECLGRREMGLEMVGKKPSKCSTFTELVDLSDIQVKFATVDELTSYWIANFDIGYAALSSLVSLHRDPEPDLEKHESIIKRFITTAMQVYQQTVKYLQANPTDRVYVFNGRFAGMRAVFRACQKMNVDCYLHERGCDGEHYELFKNHLPHDMVAIDAAINARWDAESSNPKREAIAAQFFKDRFARVEKVWHSFVKNQDTGRLPSDWDSNKKNITIFCSSDDEFVAIGDDWRNPIYENQVTAISRLAADLLVRDPKIHINLRVHPNLTQVDNQRKREMLELDYPNLSIIEPDATIDSYELLRKSDAAVSFGSTIGSEAVYWGTPSVSLGPSFYQNLGGIYRPGSHAEAIELLTKDLRPQPKTSALKYGFWLQTRGNKHVHFKSSGLFDGQFKGKTLYHRPKVTGLKLLEKRAKNLLAQVIGQ
ncbi:MAG: hypothetical protein AB8B55_07515 [Mariniblastus sp.]